MRRRTRVIALLGLGMLAAALATQHAAPLVIYNPSPSVPTGFYVRAPGPPAAVGDFVTLRAVNAAPAYAATRGFADRTDRFIKRVAAGPGQTVCAAGEAVTLDDVEIARRASSDSAGRPLPTWSGCRVLGAGEVFLLGDTPDSFDGRYWGPTPLVAIDGVWRPLGGP
ncbi:MAG: S26 family signal peptidase [Hyphomonadaceae bacterium]|nr:S26 family signal peptidase [Hyphomonadaceae bacterium]